MTILYDGKGNKIAMNEGTSSNSTLSIIGLSDTWIANANTVYNAMQEIIKTLSYDGIPFFIQTDLHGRNNAPARWLHNKDKNIKNINLGDIVTDYYNERENSTYKESASPVDNLITVFGNHEAYKKGTDIPTSYGLNYYYTDTSKEQRMYDEYGFFTHIDNTYNIKYVVISPYYMGADGNRTVAEVKTDQMKWLLNELSKYDGYDIIVLMHQLFTDTHHHRDNTLQNWQDAPVVLKNLWKVMKDRRNKRNGTITDSEGVEHTYDFTNTKSRYLCSLHGHAHEELMLTEENTTAYVSNWYGDDNACVFGLIDRKNNKLKIWEFKTTGVSDLLELDI